MKSDKAIDKTFDLVSNINLKIFDKIDEVIDWESDPTKNWTFVADLKEAISEVVIEELRNAELFEYEGNYPKKKKDLQRLKNYKRKASKLLKIDATISIKEIANELGISRQAIYKNKELKSFIDSMR